jgi:Domain of unknown function (DUF4349)
MKRVAAPVIAFVALAGFIGFLIRLPSGGGGGNSSAPAAMASAPPGAAAPFSGKIAGGGGPATGGGVSSGASSAGHVAPIPSPVAAQPAGSVQLTASELVGPRVIETAQLSLLARRHGFDQAFARATDVATRFGGYVESSSTEGVRSKLGHLTLRVPANEFQPALNSLRSIARVEDQSLSGRDVTSQYVDLQARLRNWEAQEQVLLRLMSRATTIGDTLRIQNELSQVQLRVEELKGQLRVLNNQTSLATIDVSMRESGAPLRPVPVRHHASTLVQAWRDARHGFVGVIASIVVGLGYLVPIAAVLALVWLGIRRLRPRVAA